jgi:hypothetical protein
MAKYLSEESELAKQCTKALNKLKELDQLEYRRIHVGGIPTLSGYGRRRNPQKGMSDFMICANGLTGWVETKALDGTLSDEQKEFIRLQYKHGGGKVAVITKLEELFDFLRKEMLIYV